MFLRRLPEQMRAQLANYPARDPNQLAAAADAIWAQSIKSIKLSRALSFVRFIAGLRFPQDNDLADLAFLWSKLADLRYLSVWTLFAYLADRYKTIFFDDMKFSRLRLKRFSI